MDDTGARRHVADIWTCPLCNKQVGGFMRTGLARPTALFFGETSMNDKTKTKEQLMEELRATREQLGVSHNKFQAIFNNPTHGIGLVNSKGILIQVNEVMARTLGYAPDELCGQSITVTNHPDGVEAAVEMVKRLVRGELDSYRFEQLLRRKDGSYLPCEIAGGVFRTPDETICVSILADISDRQKAQEESLRLKTQLEHLVEDRTVQLSQSIAQLESEVTVRKRAELALRESQTTLSEQNVQLAEKNIAMREMLRQLEIDKGEFIGRVLGNVDHTLLPLIHRGC
jgi:PAS domain S-box-containing protein